MESCDFDQLRWFSPERNGSGERSLSRNAKPPTEAMTNTAFPLPNEASGTDGLEILGALPSEYAAILTPEAMDFVLRLERRFRMTRKALLHRRRSTITQRLLSWTSPFAGSCAIAIGTDMATEYEKSASATDPG